MTYPSAPWTLHWARGSHVAARGPLAAPSFRPVWPRHCLGAPRQDPGRGVSRRLRAGVGSSLPRIDCCASPGARGHARGRFDLPHLRRPSRGDGGWPPDLGTPKELARFTWETGDERQVTVRQDGRVVCTLHYGRPRRLWRQPLWLPVLSFGEPTGSGSRGPVPPGSASARGAWTSQPGRRGRRSAWRVRPAPTIMTR